MHKDVRIDYGINVITVGRYSISTIKLRVKDSFPKRRIPKAVTIEHDADHGMLYIKYEALTSAESKKVIKKVGQLLKEHAHNEVEKRYEWINNM